MFSIPFEDKILKDVKIFFSDYFINKVVSNADYLLTEDHHFNILKNIDFLELSDRISEILLFNFSTSKIYHRKNVCI
jgi:hypothetical protein